MKIAMVAGGGGSGGLIAYIQGLLSVKMSDEILFVCTEGLAKAIGKVAEHVNICPLEAARERGKEVLVNKTLNAQVIEVVEAFDPDVVLYINGWVRKGLEKYPNVMILHNQLYVDNQALKQTLTYKNAAALLSFRHSVRRSLKKADGVIYLSEKSMRDAHKSGIEAKEGSVVYFGIPKNNFTNELPKHVQKDEYKLLYVSTFWGYKNHDSLVQALALLKKKGYSFEIHFVGGGPIGRELAVKDKVKKLGIENNVIFHGNLSHNKVLEAIDNSDVFVYPSAVESTGLGVMEAMARGACIACANKSCMPEVLKDAGEYFNPDNPLEIAGVIEKLLLNADLRNLYSAKALEYASAFTWEKAAEKTFVFLKKVSERK